MHPCTVASAALHPKIPKINSPPSHINLEKAHHHPRNYHFSGVVMLKF
jgi:hypothetical protein